MQSSAEKSNCVLEISPRWPESVCRHRPLEVSQTFVEWSKEPVMIRLPSVLKLSETISAVCLLRAGARVRARARARVRDLCRVPEQRAQLHPSLSPLCLRYISPLSPLHLPPEQ